MIITRTPLRISLVGGGTDTKEFYEKAPGAVVSLAIQKYIYVSVNEKFDGALRVSYSKTENVDKVEDIQHDLVKRALETFRISNGLEITSVADIPGSGSGLGSSSSFTVGLVNALGRHLHKNSPSGGGLAELAYDVEVAGHPNIGKQDHYAAACGGLNLFWFNKKSVTIRRIYTENSDIAHLERHLLLLWTGITRPSEKSLTETRKNFETDAGMKIGVELAKLANELYDEMEGGNFNNIGDYLHAGWLLKRSIKSVTSEKIDEWYSVALANGAEGGKICGAGGGGFLLFYCKPEAKNRIAQATGLRRVNFKIATEGSEVIYET